MSSDSNPLDGIVPRSFTEDMILWLSSDRNFVEYVQKTLSNANHDVEAVRRALMMTCLETLLESAAGSHPIIKMIIVRTVINSVDWSRVTDAITSSGNDSSVGSGHGGIGSVQSVSNSINERN